MLTGKIVTWNSEKGYGFIERDDGGADIFMHFRDLGDRSRNHLPIGTRVGFEVGTDERNGKPRAVKVVGLNGQSETRRAPSVREAAEAHFRGA